MSVDIASVAADWYMQRWAALREQAFRLSQEAEAAPPLAKRRLRNQAALCDQYAVICHHAAWAEANPQSPLADH